MRFLRQHLHRGAERGTLLVARPGGQQFLVPAKDVVDNGDVLGAVDVDVFDRVEFFRRHGEAHGEAHQSRQESDRFHLGLAIRLKV